MEWDISTTNLMSIIAVGVVFGYAFFTAMRLMLPRRIRAEHLHQRATVLEKAKQRAQQLRKETLERTQRGLTLSEEEFEEQMRDLQADLKASEEELQTQEEFASKEESRVAKQENQIKASQEKVAQIEEQANQAQQALQASSFELQKALVHTADCELEAVKTQLSEARINERQLESQKRLKTVMDELNTNHKRLADRALSSILSRYEPNFIWPKAVNHVEITNDKLLNQLNSDSSRLLTDLMEITDQVEITLESEKEHANPIVKLAGGYGMDKEAARMTLEEIIPRGPNAWAKVERVYEKHRKALDIQAQKLGRQAVKELKLQNIHPEIQKMVGALNWRTSYRQNQFHHSLEVAKLAGIVAYELGVDPELAKRSGLLHDIGKGIDYRIEGSHAVISGDYADRFGESRIVCDTVMSHHNDLVLETALSYVLKSADTLSGARPGARINLEEGYQVRLLAIEEVVRSFPGIMKMSIMNGGREVHIDVNHKKIKEGELEGFTAAIARKLEDNVAFPGQIRILVSRRFESVAVA